MDIPLLTTKLFIPTPHPHLVPRRRLVRRLELGLRLGRKLTLVSAQAGSGKTSLLSEWISGISPGEGVKARFTWLSLDQEDNDPNRFWTYMIAALQRLEPELGRESLVLLQDSVTPTIPELLTPLVNALAERGETIVLVLDDYHVISQQVVHEGVTFLLSHQPTNLHLALGTRADPPLPIGLLRARSQLTEVRAQDLCFTPKETSVYLNERMGLNLTWEAIRQLEARTEGWVVGLHLAALSIQGREEKSEWISAFSGKHTYILEYLSEEVIGYQPEHVQRFLTQTSILEELCGPLCDAVTGGEGSSETLVNLRRGNLFITPLDDEGTWYRYHQLFRDLLQKRLRQEGPPEVIPGLHRRASLWYEKDGRFQSAVSHAQQAGDFECVARLSEKAIQASVLDSRMTNLLGWLDRLPEELVLANLRLRFYRGLALFLDGQPESSKAVLQEAKLALQEASASPGNEELVRECATLLETIEALMGGLAYGLAGDIHESLQMSQRALKLAEGEDNAFLAALAHEGVSLNYISKGNLREAALACERIIDLAGARSKEGGREAPLPLAGMGYVQLAGIKLEWNELDPASGLLDQAIAISQVSGGGKTLVEAYLMRSRLRQAEGDLEGALESLTEAEKVDPHLRPTSYTGFRLRTQRARLDLAMGKTPAVFEWGEELKQLLHARMGGGPSPASLEETRQMLLVRAHLAIGEWEGALARLDKMRPSAEAAGRFGRLVEIDLLKGLAYQGLGEVEVGLESLEESLARALPGGYKRVFLDEGEPAIILLGAFCRRTASPGDLVDYGKVLLAEAGFGKREAIQVEEAPQDELAEPLTRRELEVLKLIQAGYTNQEIADELVLALNTVKRHASNIYSKLEVNSRTQALVRARELGLI